MRKVGFVVGAVFATLGILLYLVQYINQWECEHSPTVINCVNTGPTKMLIDYPLMAIGAGLLAYSFVNPHIHLHAVNREDSQDA